MSALEREIKKRRIKQVDLARKMGVSPAAVSLQIKSGIQMAKVASKYGKAMNCEPHLLLDF